MILTMESFRELIISLPEHRSIKPVYRRNNKSIRSFDSINFTKSLGKRQRMNLRMVSEYGALFTPEKIIRTTLHMTRVDFFYLSDYSPLPNDKIFRLVQIQSTYRRQNKVIKN